MPHKNDTVVIQEPPMQQIGRQRSCIKRTCFNGCGCMVFFIAAFAILLSILSGPRELEIHELGADIRDAIPIYDPEQVFSISYRPGVARNRALEYAAYIPKTVLSPILVVTGDQPPETSFIRSVADFVQKPVADHRDMYAIEWRNLPTKPSFLYDFHTREYESHDFTLSRQIEEPGEYRFSFKKNDVEGVLVITADTSGIGTSLMTIDVFIPTHASYGN